MIAFAPSQDGKQLTVLLLDAGHNTTLSDGTPLAHHQPLLLARAKCEGQCGTGDAAIARYLFPEISAERAGDSLKQAILDGAAWQLSGVELSIHQNGTGDQVSPQPLELRQTLRRTEDGHPQAIPSTSQEREDFGWVADLNKIAPSAGGLNPEVLSARPPAGLIAARLKLTSGKVFTYRLVRVENRVEPIHFQPLHGGGTEAPYQQALASWVEAEIQVQGDAVEIVEESFGGERKRAMKLSPRQGSQEDVEMAVLNLPPLNPSLRAAENTIQNPEPGKHFELYYELMKVPPLKSMRCVPQAAARSLARSQPEANWDALHPIAELKSDLLERIQLGIGRGPYDLVICPMVLVKGV
jgi:hypothetical protein